MSQYLDDVIFTQLFSDVDSNWEKICLAIQQMVNEIGRKQKFLGEDEEENMKSAVMVHAFTKIRKFDAAKSSSAFSYFTGIIINQYKTMFSKQAQHKRCHLKFIKNHVTLDELFAMREITIPDAKKRKVKPKVKVIKKPFDMMDFV